MSKLSHRCSLPIPRDIPAGRYEIRAADTNDSSDSVHIDVERSDNPVDVSANPETLIRLWKMPDVPDASKVHRLQAQPLYVTMGNINSDEVYAEAETVG